MAADFAVSAAIRAVDKFSASMGKMGAAMGKFGSSAEGAFGRAEKSAGLFRKMLGANILGNLVTGGIRRITGEIKSLAMEGLDYASSLVEVQNVIDTSFGPKGAAKVNAWARTASNAFGLSRLQAKQFSGVMGAMLKSSGLAGEKIVQMSTSLAGLAGDMASFYDLPIEESFQKIQAGISGETEPLKRLGINMSVANLQAYALSQGITKKFAAMKQGEQTILRYQYLLSTAADAQGDFMRTAESSFAVQRRLWQTNVMEVAGTAMSAILPLATEYLGKLNKIIPKVVDWVTANKDLIATKVEAFVGKAVKFLQELRPIAAAVVKIVGWLISNKDQLIMLWIDWTLAQLALNIAMNANPIGAVVLAIEALIGVAVLIVMHWKDIKTWVDQVWTSIKKFATGVWDTVIPYIRAFGGTLLKYWLIPLNLVIDAVRGIIWVMAQLPGKAGEGFRGALDAITAFQDKANAFLTGSEKQFGFGDLWKNLGTQAPNEEAAGSARNWRGEIYVKAEPGTSARLGEVTRHAPQFTGEPYWNP